MGLAFIGKVYLLLACLAMVHSDAVAAQGDCNDYEAFLTDCGRLPDSSATTY